MRVFVTGAAGFIGTATTKELIANGHTVLGLARSDARSEAQTGTGPRLFALRPPQRSADGHPPTALRPPSLDAIGRYPTARSRAAWRVCNVILRTSDLLCSMCVRRKSCDIRVTTASG